MEYFLTSTPIPGMLLWILFYVSDYYMTIFTAKGFKDIDVYSFEKSFELTPQFQQDVERQARFSRKHIFYLVAYTLIILLLWFMFVYYIGLYWLYSFFIGALILLETAIHMRHFRNAYQIRVYKREGGLNGKLLFGQRYSYLLSAFDLYAFAVLFLLLSVVTFSPFLFGGAISCFATAIRHSRHAKKTSPLTIGQNADSSS